MSHGHTSRHILILQFLTSPMAPPISPTPHRNGVLNFLIQQKVASAVQVLHSGSEVPGFASSCETRLPEIPQVTMKCLPLHRETELENTHRLVFCPKGSQGRTALPTSRRVQAVRKDTRRPLVESRFRSLRDEDIAGSVTGGGRL